MKPQLLKVTTDPTHSFSVRQDLVPYINNKWHYHSEVELICISRGSGTQFIGDSIKRFETGDLVLVGSNLPHYWRYDDAYFNDDTVTAKAIVTHFNEDFWGEKFLLLPENKLIKNILEKAKRGIIISGETKQTVTGILESMLKAEGPERIVLLLRALSEVANSHEITFLSSIGFRPEFAEIEHERINAIYEYSIANFKRKIELEEIAAVARISPNSFCRYFKSRTKKTYTQFLNEIRIGHACKLLIENKQSVKQLCYESGFNNFTSFHKFFKVKTGKSPLNYQKEITNQR